MAGPTQVQRAVSVPLHSQQPDQKAPHSRPRKPVVGQDRAIAHLPQHSAAAHHRPAGRSGDAASLAAARNHGGHRPLFHLGLHGGVFPEGHRPRLHHGPWFIPVKLLELARFLHRLRRNDRDPDPKRGQPDLAARSARHAPPPRHHPIPGTPGVGGAAAQLHSAALERGDPAPLHLLRLWDPRRAAVQRVLPRTVFRARGRSQHGRHVLARDQRRHVNVRGWAGVPAARTELRAGQRAIR
mmetsp:Transcript_39310/g.93035  ORF Transcript_39310/g.93035 Transcript_39310/m.93035 type:complete len:240 (+) Transcript_39310:314-1033(+)